jgi:orotate phosphoribosyltransferase
MIDCSQYTGRRREICEGESAKGHAIPVAERRIMALVKWGHDLDEATEHVRSTTSGRQRVRRAIGGNRDRQRSAIGTRLMEIFKREWEAIIPCSECKAEIARLDTMTPEQVRADFDATADRIAGRIENVVPNLWMKIAAKADRHTIGYGRKRVAACLDEAIQTGALPKPARKPVKVVSGPFAMNGHAPEFVNGESLARDVRTLIGKLPPNVSAVVGIARSGLDVAAMIAKHLHLPLWAAAQNRSEIVNCGSGWRIQGSRTVKGPVLLVDDTVMTGNSQKSVQPWVRKKFPDLITAAVYVNPAARVKPDLWARDLPWPHLLEWNLFNSILSPNAAVDFDGILCCDCPLGDDDDGPRYERFLKNAPPLYLPRRVPIPLIVTARLNKYRPQTEEWLQRHSVTVKKLVMGPWATLADRRRDDVAAFKAEHFDKWAASHRAKPAPLMFVESDDRQAQKIAAITQRLVICPSSRKCYQ